MYQTFFNNKYGAKKTTYKDIRYDSKFEASIAQELDLRKSAGDIAEWDRQFKVEMWVYTKTGKPAFKVSHKVDFRIQHKDGSFELVEAKGVETTDYKWRRKFLEHIWLPEHPEYVYTVVKQGGFGRRWG